jgi:hypothetical protein
MPKLFGKSLDILVLTDEMRDRLVESLMHDINNLYNLLGCDIVKWSV